MSIALQISETQDELIINVKRPRIWWETIAGSVFTGIFTYAIASSYPHSHHTVVLAIALGVAFLSSLFEFRPRSIATTITKFEAVLTGSFGGGYSPKRNVPLADIAQLEYRPGTHKPYRPEGLYASLKWGGACIVPYINQAQSELIKEAILKRFGHVIGSSPDAGIRLATNDIISLNLNKP